LLYIQTQNHKMDDRILSFRQVREMHLWW